MTEMTKLSWKKADGCRLGGAVDELMKALPKTFPDYSQVVFEAKRCLRSNGIDLTFNYFHLRQRLKLWRGKEASRVKRLFWEVMGVPPGIRDGKGQISLRDPGLG